MLAKTVVVGALTGFAVLLLVQVLFEVTEVWVPTPEFEAVATVTVEPEVRPHDDSEAQQWSEDDGVRFWGVFTGSLVLALLVINAVLVGVAYWTRAVWEKRRVTALLVGGLALAVAVVLWFRLPADPWPDWVLLQGRVYASVVVPCFAMLAVDLRGLSA